MLQIKKGQIIKALAGHYYVASDQVIYECRARGKFRQDKIKPLVGDFVEFQVTDPGFGYLMHILPRENIFLRPPIANVDQVFIVMSAVEPAFSTHLVDRFLAVIEAQNLKPIILVTKMDLVTDQSALFKETKPYQSDGYEVLYLSNQDQSIKQLLPYLKTQLSLFTGQSGVGKSSALNVLNPEAMIETNVISKALNRGKHTTRHVELYPVGDGLIADTPGFSLLEIHLSAEQLAHSYHDFKALSLDCKFRGCLHDQEPDSDCAVKRAVLNGQISATRYQHYLQFLKEIKERKERYR